MTLRVLDPRQSAHGEDLIGTKGGIRFTGTMVHINHVEQAAALLVPELFLK